MRAADGRTGLDIYKQDITNIYAPIKNEEVRKDLQHVITFTQQLINELESMDPDFEINFVFEEFFGDWVNEYDFYDNPWIAPTVTDIVEFIDAQAMNEDVDGWESEAYSDEIKRQAKIIYNRLETEEEKILAKRLTEKLAKEYLTRVRLMIKPYYTKYREKYEDMARIKAKLNTEE